MGYTARGGWDEDVVIPSKHLLKKIVLGDHTLYLGIQIAEENLVHTDRLRLAILPERGELLPFLSEIQAFDACEHPLVIQSQNIPEASYEGHYVQDLKEHYCHYLYEIELQESKASCSLTSLFPKLKEETS